MRTTVVGVLAVVMFGGYGMAQTNEVAPTLTPAQVKALVPQLQALWPKTWIDYVTLKGDLRYRYEQINDDSQKNADKKTYSRERERIRARLAAEAKCNDNLKATIGVSTGGADPISGNQTIGDGGQKKEMRLDLAYMDYSFIGDATSNTIHGFAGKMKNPFSAMNDDLMWDPDLSPEGLALKGQLGVDKVTVSGNAGYIWVQERNSRPPARLYAGQGAVKVQFVPAVALTVGASYFGFQNLQGFDVIDWQGANGSYGNSTTKGTVSGSTTNKAWATGFTPVVYFASLDLGIAGVPVSIYGQELHNADVSKLGQGRLFGVSLGKAQNPGSFEAGYSYAQIEKDATLGMWTDSERWGGGTDGKGNKIYVKYQLLKNLQAGVNYYKDSKGIASGAATDFERLQVELLASF